MAELTTAEKRYMTETASVYLAAAELAMRRFVVSATTRNAPGVDILARSPTKHDYGIQVKGNHWTSGQTWWAISKRAKTEVSPTTFYVFVNLKKPGIRPDFYIVPSQDVAEKMYVSRHESGDWYGFDRDPADLEQWDRLK